MENRDRKSSTTSRVKAIKTVCIVLVVALVLSFVIYAIIRTVLGDGESLGQTVIEWRDGHPVISGIVMMFFCVIQVVIAFIPGELVEQACGVFFGTWGGLLFCLIGTTVGSSIAILLGNRFGKDLVYAILPKEKIEANEFLTKGRKRDITVFLLFLIPGTPKDLLTYVISLTDMSLPRYLLLTTAARIPSIVTSTLSGEMIASAMGGEEVLRGIAILNGAILAVAVVGYAVYFLIKFLAKKKKNNNNGET